MKHYLPFLAILACLSSCVPKTQYDSLLMSNAKTQSQRDSLLDVSSRIPGMQQAVESSTAELRSLKRNYQKTQADNIGLENQNKEMMARFNELQEQNNLLLSNSNQQTQLMQKELARRTEALDKREHELGLMKTDLEQKKAALSEVNSNYTAYEKKIKELEAAVAENQRQTEALKAKISTALQSFNAGELQVTERNGKIYVSLSQELLFASGSDQMDTRGLSAIDKLAGALKQNPDVAVNVEGHTDADGAADSNWDLSTRRATSVVKRLSQSGCNPKQLTASGRAFYDPIAPNDSPENKAKNRRTEIIIAPNLQELMMVRQ